MKTFLAVQALKNLTSQIALLRKLLEDVLHKNQGINEDIRCRKWDSTQEGDEGMRYPVDGDGYPRMTLDQA